MGAGKENSGKFDPHHEVVSVIFEFIAEHTGVREIPLERMISVETLCLVLNLSSPPRPT